MEDEERRLGDWLSSWPHRDAHAVRPGLNTAVRVEFMHGPPYTHTGGKHLLHMSFSLRFCTAAIYQ